MKTKNKKAGTGLIIMGVIGVIILIMIIGFVGQAYSLWSFKFWQPKIEDAKRDVWEQTNSRINGATQQIAKSQLEYTRTNSTKEKNAICASLRMMYPDITPEEIDDNRLRTFYSKCKYGG